MIVNVALQTTPAIFPADIGTDQVASIGVRCSGQRWFAADNNDATTDVALNAQPPSARVASSILSLRVAPGTVTGVAHQP
jgi:hypothetical protein